MLSKTAEYALRAVIAIAEVEEERPVLAREIATKGHIPNKYLSKVLRDLVHAGVLSSTRGIGGGFRLRRRASKLKLIEIVKPFDDIPARSRCPLGHPKCSDDNPCAMHDQWRPVKESFRALLDDTTVAQIVDKERELNLGRHAGRSRRHEAASEEAE
jgi:Rrf2 family protein